MMKTNSDLTLEQTIEKISSFNPVKIYYNNDVLWDGDVEIDDEFVTFEKAFSLFAYTNKNWESYRIFNIEIQIVSFHHSIIYLYGKEVKE